MSERQTTRNLAVRRRRGAGASQRELAAAFGVSRWRIRQILDSGGDPLFNKMVARASEKELARLGSRLDVRIARNLARLAALENALAERATVG